MIFREYDLHSIDEYDRNVLKDLWSDRYQAVCQKSLEIFHFNQVNDLFFQLNECK